MGLLKNFLDRRAVRGTTDFVLAPMDGLFDRTAYIKALMNDPYLHGCLMGMIYAWITHLRKPTKADRDVMVFCVIKGAFGELSALALGDKFVSYGTEGNSAKSLLNEGVNRGTRLVLFMFQVGDPKSEPDADKALALWVKLEDVSASILCENGKRARSEREYTILGLHRLWFVEPLLERLKLLEGRGGSK